MATDDQDRRERYQAEGPVQSTEGTLAQPGSASAREGIYWLQFGIWCVVVTAMVAATSYRFALISLMGVFVVAIVLFNTAYMAVARFCGLAEVEEFAVGYGPVLARFSVHGTRFRFGGLLLGGYVKFPGQGEAGEPCGFNTLHPVRQAAIALSGPVAAAFAGLMICLASGNEGVIGRAVAWIASGDVLYFESWKSCLRALLLSVASAGDVPRVAGAVMLLFGMFNLLPLPVFSGGVAARIIWELTTRRKISDRLWTQLAVPGLLLVAAFAVVWVCALVSVLFWG